ncbi:DNA cytosine methyltransferase [Jeotgalibacillus sp. R-1-5s-1]|uniref:DNA cytosine methyltransferase n=1 Tax=Jeotgalibacillus sp. R-1-5s-1 TaxID=2555897 RepID=UPI00106D7CD3|nr:DNA cytosine methyltransferase [Jeotgalibacillus sp. R-1-5s-1]TFD99520.1 DNA cytosine methyltransferase [Jeotgalibacillus sp. R-1-5s-1]
MRKIKILDLFAGGGGFSTGFQMAKFKNLQYEVIKALEINEEACKTLENHLGKEKVCSGDITDPAIKDKLVDECQGVNVIIGGPPCQTFSLAGPARSGTLEKREALKNDPRNTLYKHFFDVVSRIKPQFVVFENVQGITSKKVKEKGLSEKDSQVIELICDELESLGYTTEIENSFTKRYQILNSVDFEVPQFRKRIIIVANRLDLVNPVPVRSSKEKSVKDAIYHLPLRLPIISSKGLRKLKNIEHILKNLNYCLEVFMENLSSLAEREKDKQIKNNLENLHQILLPEYEELRNKKSYKLLGLEKFLILYNESIKELGLEQNISVSGSFTNHSSRAHNFRDVIVFILTQPGSNSSRFMDKKSADYDKFLSDLYPYSRDKHKDTYVKHSWDRPSSTILAHMEKDGLKFIHPEQPRTYTPYEAALIQSFPDNYSFYGGRNAQYRQIGNAVPPLMAKAIGLEILKLIDTYQSVLKEEKALAKF